MYIQPAPEPARPSADHGESDPARLARIYQAPRSAVLIPALQALIVGAAAGIALGALIWAAEIYALIPARSGAPALWGFIAAALATLFSMLGGFRRWAASVAWMEGLVETMLQKDLDGDGQIGDAAPAPAAIRVELTQQTGPTAQAQLFTLPTTPEKFRDLARGVVEGQPLSERRWAGSGALYSQAEFRRLRDEMIKRGLLRWIDERYPNQGIEITRAGRAVLEHFAGKRFPAVVDTVLPYPT